MLHAKAGFDLKIFGPLSNQSTVSASPNAMAQLVIFCAPPSSLSLLIPTHPTPHNRNRVHLFPSNAKTSCAWRALDLFLSLPFFCPIPRSLHSTRFLTIGFGEFLLNITTLSEYLKMSVLAVEQLAER